MEDSRTKKTYQWTPHGRRRRGRPQLSWKNQVMDCMRSRNIEVRMAEYMYLWRLGMHRWLLAIKIIIIIIIIIIVQVPFQPRTFPLKYLWNNPRLKSKLLLVGYILSSAQYLPSLCHIMKSVLL